MTFDPLKDNFSLPKAEEEVLAFWKEHQVFEKAARAAADRKPFVFYEGPPTANGRPGIHHVMSRTIKDMVCRYKSQRGFRVDRKAGWDTHGLPVEIEVEKQLGLEGREQVEEYGIEKYNAACRESVLKYKELWDTLTVRMGYWVDLDNPYITFTNEYIESVWWLLKQLWNKDLLYKGFKIQWYSPGSNTVLSSHEVAQGYKEVQDPSVYVRFRIKGETNTFFPRLDHHPVDSHLQRCPRGGAEYRVCEDQTPRRKRRRAVFHPRPRPSGSHQRRLRGS